MKKVQRPHRCGQCGRSYTKAQWRRNDFWCQTCKKIVCYDCVGYGRVCPGCGTKTSRNIRQGALFGAMMGGTFLFMGFFFLAFSYFGATDMWFIWPLMVLGASSAVASVTLSVFNRKQVRMHEEHMSRLPSGTIPLEKRAGYGDLSARNKWKEANLARNMTRYGGMKDTYPDHIYEGLVGNWDYPVMTKEERIYFTDDIRKKALVYSAGMIAVGMLIAVLGFLFVEHFFVRTLGVMLALTGSMIVVLVFYAKRVVRSDVEGEVKVVWKTIGFEAAREAMEGFIREKDLDAKLIKKKYPMWEHSEHRYELADGNSISFTYSENRDGHVYGWVAIGYKPAGTLAAKKLQTELDEYLCERDLVRRAG
jgi:hypothetical protein